MVAVVVVVVVGAGNGAGVTTGAVDAISAENGAELVMFVAGTVVDADAVVAIVAAAVVLTPPRVVVDGALVRSWDLVKG